MFSDYLRGTHGDYMGDPVALQGEQVRGGVHVAYQQPALHLVHG